MRIWTVLFVLLGVVVLIFVFGPAYSRYSLTLAKIRQVSKEVRLLRKENAYLKESLERLRNDPSALEELARREYRMGRPGEIVYVVAPEED